VDRRRCICTKTRATTDWGRRDPMTIPPTTLASLNRILGDVERSRRFEQALADVRAVRAWLERVETERAVAAERESR
jgi:hypothetical protein